MSYAAAAAISSSSSTIPPPSNPSDNNGPAPEYQAPASVLIVGSGVFGLSTALELARRPAFAATQITVLDRSPEAGVFPARDASSIDSSRIIRADYADGAYAALASEASVHWRAHLTAPADDPEEKYIGAAGRYSESGLLLGADDPSGRGESTRPDGYPTGLGYCKASWINALALAEREGRPMDSVRLLPSRTAVGKLSTVGAEFADWGYLNEASGWAHATDAMAWTYRRAVETGRIAFVNGTAASLATDNGKVMGVRLAGDENKTLSADLTILATGAWTPGLLDMSRQAVATGQVLGYIKITPEEQARLAKMPVLLNLSHGLFVIPPRDGVLKVARHAYGYLNPSTSKSPLHSSTDKPISLPYTHLDDPSLSVPPEGIAALRQGLKNLVPILGLSDRPFFETRLCWYTDTPTGDWIVDYHPSYSDSKSLFLATGGSGHAFKFLPVLGRCVVDSIMGNTPAAFREKWRWPKVEGQGSSDIEKAISTEDGSRGGRPGLILQEEMRKSPSVL